jgi:hypothetical protein
MRTNWRRFLSFSKVENDWTKNYGNKFEIVSCAIDGKNCKNYLSEINNCFLISNQSNQNKDFQNAIEALKKGFYKSCELNDPVCLNCSNMFRSTIKQSLANIHSELENISDGLFGAKRYFKSYLMACDALNELKQVG